MALPIETRVRVCRHWLVQGFTGTVVAHREEQGHDADNDVLLDKPWVPTRSMDPEFCRRMFFADQSLEAI